MMGRKWFLELVQDFDGTYYANLTVNGNLVSGLPEHVDYRTLVAAIREKTGICILPRKEMIFARCGRKRYAYIDATQPRQDCRVLPHEIRAGYKPSFA